jgi:DNA transposition AAA+ family ATPase
MSLLPHSERQLFQVAKDHRHACQIAVIDYVDRTGIHPSDFAKRIGFSARTITTFLGKKNLNVSRAEWNIIKAAQAYMEAHPIAPVRPVEGDLFETANVRLIRDTFTKLLIRPRAFMIYAPPGSQKTFVVQHEVYALNQREIAKGQNAGRAYYVRAREGIRPSDMLKRIATACGTQSTGSIDRILTNLRIDHQGHRSVLVIDEAQLMDLSCFEVIRELLDSQLFSLLITGSHDLFRMFERASATLEQWNSRIAQKVRLPGCSQEEARAIVFREAGHIPNAPSLSGKDRKSTADQIADKLIKGATVIDAYVPVAEGSPQATYINIRTLCNALDDLRTQFAAAQKESAV